MAAQVELFWDSSGAIFAAIDVRSKVISSSAVSLSMVFFILLVLVISSYVFTK